MADTVEVLKEDTTRKLPVGMELQFNNVCVSRDGNPVLENVSGVAKPGELLAIMGPSGAGKTTLLNTLSGRVTYSGDISINGTTLNKKLKRRICYVMQQEAFFGNLTLRETLTFTAMIRLPDEMPRVEKMLRMHTVVETLDLTQCMDTAMGDMFMPGLSGGEQKRASIACELLRDPQIIFLDEPTTGLDSSTASSLIAMLKNYVARSNKTVVASIHQPSSHLFYLFNKLLLLNKGQVAYFGETDKVANYFQSIGVPLAEHHNPADFILEVLSDSEETQEHIMSIAKEKFHSMVTSSVVQSKSTEVKKSSKETPVDRILRKMKNKPSPARERTVSETSDFDTGSVHMSLLELDTIGEIVEDDRKWPTGFCTQYMQLTQRTFRESRKRILSPQKLLENVLICAFVSLFFFRLPRNEETLRDRMGAVFFIAAHWGFIPLFDAVTSFPMERVVINKERAAGWYRLSAYYLAKMTSELILILIQPTVFVIIVYWVVGLNGISAFFATIATVFIDSIAGQSFGLFIGITCMEISQAMTVSITCQMTIMLLGGLFTRTLPFWLDWMKYLSFLHYTFHSLMYLEFTDAPPVQCLEQKNKTVFTACRSANTTTISSSVVLQHYNVTWEYWQYILPLIFFTILFRTLGYIVLRFIRKPL